MNGRRWLHPFVSALGYFERWLVSIPYLEFWSIFVVTDILVALWMVGFHEHQMPWLPMPGEEIPLNWNPPSEWTLLYFRVVPYVKVAALLTGVVFHIAIVRAQGDLRRLVVPAWVICILLAAWLGAADFHDQWERVNGTVTGRPFPLGACVMKVVLLVLGLLSPAVALTYYQTRCIWEKHVLRLFIQPLVFCLVAFCSLMLLVDFIDNLHDFQDNAVPVTRILSFYMNLTPSLFVKAVPLALVLGTLWALISLVKGNEMVSLLCSGLSMSRILKPILVCAAGLSFVAMVVNYDAAQQAEGERQAVMRGIQTKQSATVMASAVMHYHESTRRLWFVSYVPFNLRDERMRGVQVRQFDAEGNLESSISSASVAWLPDGTWSFSRGVTVYYSGGMSSAEVNFNKEEKGKRRFDAKGWPETLWDIISSTLNPDMMGVPDLASYMTSHGATADWRALQHARTELWRRLSSPWEGFALVCFVAALTPIHSRRGLAKYVGISILTYLGLIFFTNAVVNIARGGHLPAGLVLWIPHLMLVCTGAYLLWHDANGPRHALRRSIRVGRALRGRATEPMHQKKGFFSQNEAMRQDEEDELEEDEPDEEEQTPS